MKKDQKNTQVDIANQNLSADLAEAQEIKSRKLKYGTLATVFTILFVVAVIVVNIFVGYLTDRFVLEFDMTSENLYDISEDTREVLADLNEPIKITVLAEETTYKDSTDLLCQIHEVLQRYEALSNGMVSVEYVNPNLNPQLQEKFATLGGLSANDIIIESSKRFKHLTPSNLYELEQDDDGNTYVVGLRAEQRLTSGILFTLADVIPQAVFTTGHDETTSLESFQSLLTTSNYDIGYVNLGTEEIPEEATLIIISSPVEDFTDEEIDKLDAFMAEGGDMIVSMSVSVTEELTNLERYFEEWGIKYETAMIFDTTRCLSGYPMYVVPNLASLEGLTDNLNLRTGYVTIPGARPIDILFSESGWRLTTPLMTTSSTAYAKSAGKAVTTYDREADDEVGEFNVAVMASETHTDNLDYTYSYAMFINAGMITDSVLDIDNMLNSKYITAAVGFMTEDSEAVVVEAKEYSSTTLSVLGSQVTILFWILCIIIPFGILALGMIIWLRRRHL